jgi:hypothetical protein
MVDAGYYVELTSSQLTGGPIGIVPEIIPTNPIRIITSGNPGAVSYRRVPACLPPLSTCDGRKQNVDWQALENIREGEAANDRRANFERKDAK